MVIKKGVYKWEEPSNSITGWQEWACGIWANGVAIIPTGTDKWCQDSPIETILREMNNPRHPWSHARRDNYVSQIKGSPIFGIRRLRNDERAPHPTTVDEMCGPYGAFYKGGRIHWNLGKGGKTMHASTPEKCLENVLSILRLAGDGSGFLSNVTTS